MKRTLRRIIGVSVGLSLGWWAAGLLPGSLSAEPARPGHEAPANKQHDAAHADDSAAKGHDAHHEADAGLIAARQIVPSREQVPWLRPVLLGVGGLFAAAILIGVPLSRMKPKAEPTSHHH